jgi:hypothetical protein
MIDTQLRLFLLNQMAVSSVVSGVYPVRLPQNSAGTSIVYEVNHGVAERIAGGVTGVRRYDISMSVYSPSYATSRELTETLTILLNGYAGMIGTESVTSSLLITQINTFEEKTLLYRSILTFDIYTN